MTQVFMSNIGRKTSFPQKKNISSAPMARDITAGCSALLLPPFGLPMSYGRQGINSEGLKCLNID